jgi:hypothetical protein
MEPNIEPNVGSFYDLKFTDGRNSGTLHVECIGKSQTRYKFKLVNENGGDYNHMIWVEDYEYSEMDNNYITLKSIIEFYDEKKYTFTLMIDQFDDGTFKILKEFQPKKKGRSPVSEDNESSTKQIVHVTVPVPPPPRRVSPPVAERRVSPEKRISPKKKTSPLAAAPQSEKKIKDEIYVVPLDDYQKSTVYKDNAKSFRADKNQNAIFENIQMLIEDTQYNSNNFVKTYKSYQKYCHHFVEEKQQQLDPKHHIRVRIFAILADKLYPYYVEKYGHVVTNEMFIMAIFYYYFSVRHSNDVDVSGYIYGIKTENTKKFNNILFFLSTLEPKLSNLLIPIHGGKPKTKKNKLRKSQKTRRTQKSRRTRRK